MPKSMVGIPADGDYVSHSGWVVHHSFWR